MLRIIEIEPKACPRPRVTRRGVFYPSSYIEWTKRCCSLLDSLRLPRLIGPIELDITFVIKRPQSLRRKADPEERIPHIRRPDLDNYLKSVLDAAQKSGLFEDDSQIYRINAEKKYSGKTEHPRIIFEMRESR